MVRTINTTQTAASVVSDRELDIQLRKLSADIQSEQKVRIRLPKDPMDPDGAQYVGINGYALYIPRGIFVEVPYSVYQLLEQQGVL